MCEGGKGHLCAFLCLYNCFRDHWYVEVVIVTHQVFPLQEGCKEGLQVRSSNPLLRGTGPERRSRQDKAADRVHLGEGQGSRRCLVSEPTALQNGLFIMGMSHFMLERHGKHESSRKLVLIP